MERNEIVIYQSQDGTIKVDVLFEGKTVWLTMDQMTVLFGKSRSTINEHILNVFKEGELVEEDSVRKIGNSDFSYTILLYKFTFLEYIQNMLINCRT